MDKITKQFPILKKTSWAHYSYLAAKILIDQAFLLGALPLRFNLKVTKNRMRRVNSKFHILRYNFCFWIIGCIDISLGYLIVKDLYIGTESLTSAQSVYRVLISVGAILCLFVGTHSYFRMDDISTFINGCVSYYEEYQDKYCLGKKENPIREDLICGGLKLFYIVGVNFISICCGIFFTFKCKFHVLEPLAKGYTCTENGNHVNPYMIPFWALMQTYVLEFNMVSFFLYIDIALALLVFGQYTIDQYLTTEEIARTIRLLRTEDNLDHGYKCIQIITRAINNCVSDIMMPGHMLLMNTLLVLIVSGTIRFGSKLSGEILFFCVVVVINIVSYMIFFMSFGAKVLEKTEEMRQRKIRRIRDNDKYMETMVRTYRPNKLKIGEFAYLEKSTLVAVLETVVDYTMTLLLM